MRRTNVCKKEENDNCLVASLCRCALVVCLPLLLFERAAQRVAIMIMYYYCMRVNIYCLLFRIPFHSQFMHTARAQTHTERTYCMWEGARCQRAPMDYMANSQPSQSSLPRKRWAMRRIYQQLGIVRSILHVFASSPEWNLLNHLPRPPWQFRKKINFYLFCVTIPSSVCCFFSLY